MRDTWRGADKAGERKHGNIFGAQDRADARGIFNMTHAKNYSMLFCKLLKKKRCCKSWDTVYCVRRLN